MVDKKTQKTPKGYTIPVPTRREVEDALDKMASVAASTCQWKLDGVDVGVC
jgi:hypothetical protein